MAGIVNTRGASIADGVLTFVGSARELIINTDEWSISIHDGVTPGGWPVRSVLSTKVVTGSGTLLVLPSDVIVKWNGTANTILQLGPAPANGEAHIIVYGRRTAPFYNLTILPGSGHTINYASQLVLTTPGTMASLAFDGVNDWTVIG